MMKEKEANQKPTLQRMCDEIQEMGDILACYAFTNEGKLLGASYGQIEVDDKLKQDFSQIAAGVWSDLERVTTIGGEISLVSITYQNFKILGFPIAKSNTAVLLTIDNSIDEKKIEERVKDFITYWTKVNRYIE